MSHADTIVALSTPIASALRAIIRLSGEQAFELVGSISAGPCEPLRHACAARRTLHVLPDLPVGVEIYSFHSPCSPTGENVAELHLPASPFLVATLLKRFIQCGARQAEPGEFTARAFFNGKLDLTAAEGVAGAIAASNRAELDAARQLAGGELVRRLTPFLDELTSTLALVEVGIDFTEEDVTFLASAELEVRLLSVRSSLSDLLSQSAHIERLSREPRIVLAGRPNAGKSTLLNALAGSARAVVSDVEGTTRDALSAEVALRRGFVMLIDVAGVEAASDDSISMQMQSISARQIETADAVILLIDARDKRPFVQLTRAPDLIVYTKSDLACPPEGELGVDALHGRKMDTLRVRLDEIAFGSVSPSTLSLAINSRHVAAIEMAIRSIDQARHALTSGGELIASELRGAINHLGGVLGRVSADDVLGKIFSSFCIGK